MTVLDTFTAEHRYSKSPTHQSPDRQTDTLVIQGIVLAPAAVRPQTRLARVFNYFITNRAGPKSLGPSQTAPPLIRQIAWVMLCWCLHASAHTGQQQHASTAH